jgi:hypothetical protein
MSHNNGDGQNKIAVECPTCQTRFSLPMPPVEFANSKYSSAVVAPHEKLSSCIACGQQFLLYIEKAMITWGAGALSEQGVQEFEGSKVIKPPSGLIVP